MSGRTLNPNQKQNQIHMKKFQITYLVSFLLAVSGCAIDAAPVRAAERASALGTSPAKPPRMAPDPPPPVFCIDEPGVPTVTQSEAAKQIGEAYCATINGGTPCISTMVAFYCPAHVACDRPVCGEDRALLATCSTQMPPDADCHGLFPDVPAFPAPEQPPGPPTIRSIEIPGALAISHLPNTRLLSTDGTSYLGWTLGNDIDAVVTYPVVVPAGSTITGWSIAVHKASGDGDLLVAQLRRSRYMISEWAGAFITNHEPSPGDIVLDESALDVKVEPGWQYYILVQPAGTTATDRTYSATITFIQPDA